MRSIYLGRRKGGSTVGSLLSEIYSSRGAWSREGYITALGGIR